MTLRIITIFAGVLGIVSCSMSVESERPGTEASGTFVREYAVEISNPETGKKIGMRQIRDSIFIETSDSGYKVSNHKWRMNDYDQEGWVSMAHADDRPLPTFFASYDQNTNSLKPQGQEVPNSIYLDQENGKLFKDQSKKNGYSRID